jgi:diguanylate cyclase (GGDEF)-like protein/PAS domain S-box-containing protein
VTPPQRSGSDAPPTTPGVPPDEPILVSAPVPTVAVDLSGEVCLWNPAAEAQFGWPADEVLGQFPPLLDPERLDEVLDLLTRLLSGEQITHERHLLHRRHGPPFIGLLSASLLRDADDDPLAVLIMVRDISTDEHVLQARRDAEVRWRRLAMQAMDSVSFTDADGHVQETSHHSDDAFGYPTEWWAGRNGFDVLHPDDVGRAGDLWADLLAHPGTRRRAVLRVRHARGHVEQVEYTGLNLLDDPMVGAVVVASRVVSAQLQNERLVSDEARALALIARDTPLEVVWDELLGTVEYHTGGLAAVLFHDDEADVLRLRASGSIGPEVQEIAERHATGELPVDLDQFLHHRVVITDLATDPRAREWGPALTRVGFRSGWGQPIVETPTASPRGVLAVLVPDERAPTDHERKVVAMAAHLAAIALARAGWQQELRRRARFDELTGLPNRTAIFEYLDMALADARVQRLPVTAMVIDVDRFKLVNDSLGHDQGDLILKQIAERFAELAGDGDLTGHMAADEFVVVFAPGVRLSEAKLAARTLARTMEVPFTVDDSTIHLTVSIGLAMSSLGRENADALLQRADTAMFRAKATGRDRIEVYDERLRSRAVKRLEIDRDLRVALERNELEVHYQPEIDCVSGRIVGAEALLRWQHPTRGLIHPEGFITVAEETGIIVPIGHWVLDEAVRQARTWTDAHPGIEPFAISVNLSARQLINRSLVDTVAFVLTRYDWPPSHLTLELTESILIEDRDATLFVLNRLRLLGVKLAIDDFGTGFASLDYLHRLHVDWIKIDRSFVRMLDAEGNGSPVATAMMHLARAFELGVIAEGVEEPRQLDGLRALGCDVVQGFLFAKPLPPDELESSLTTQSHHP